MKPARASNHRALFLAPSSAFVDELVESFSRGGIDVLGVVATASEAIAAFERDLVDVILVRRDLGREDAFEAGKEILQRAPEARLVLFGALDDRREADLAIEMGFYGFLHEDMSSVGFAAVIASLLGSDDAPSPGDLPQSEWDATWRLTARERSVLELAEGGATSRAIAEVLGMSELDVRSCLEGIVAMLGDADASTGGPLDGYHSHLHTEPLDDFQLRSHLRLLHPRRLDRHAPSDVQELRRLHGQLHAEGPPRPA